MWPTPSLDQCSSPTGAPSQMCMVKYWAEMERMFLPAYSLIYTWVSTERGECLYHGWITHTCTLHVHMRVGTDVHSRTSLIWTLGPLKCVLIREAYPFQGTNNTCLYEVQTSCPVSWLGGCPCPLGKGPLYTGRDSIEQAELPAN